MINLNYSTLICLPIKQVFEFITTPLNDTQWQYGTLATHQAAAGFMSAGSFFSTFGHFLGRRIQSNYEITQFEANRKYGFRSVSGPVEIRTSYTFEAAEHCTRLDVSTQMIQHGFFKISDALVARFAKKQFKENMATLKSLLEA